MHSSRVMHCITQLTMLTCTHTTRAKARSHSACASHLLQRAFRNCRLPRIYQVLVLCFVSFHWGRVCLYWSTKHSVLFSKWKSNWLWCVRYPVINSNSSSTMPTHLATASTSISICQSGRQQYQLSSFASEYTDLQSQAFSFPSCLLDASHSQHDNFPTNVSCITQASAFQQVCTA